MKEMPEKKKIFISDWELRRDPGNIPADAIISPLSRDWLDYGDRGAGSAGRSGGGCPLAGNLAEVALRRKMAEIGRRLYALGFVPATDGNISARLADGSVLITPSGVSKGGLTPEDMAKIGMDGAVISGKKPSSEYLLHLCVYRARPDVMAVVHAHPPLATGFACASLALDKPLTSEMVISLGKVPLADYATPGTEEVIRSVERLVGGHNALLLSNHGAVTYGPDLDVAFQRMETVEQAAKITLVTEHLGGGRLISPEKVAQLELIRKRLGL